jgi:hypothetical protein
MVRNGEELTKIFYIVKCISITNLENLFYPAGKHAVFGGKLLILKPSVPACRPWQGFGLVTVGAGQCKRKTSGVEDFVH